MSSAPVIPERMRHADTSARPSGGRVQRGSAQRGSHPLRVLRVPATRHGQKERPVRGQPTVVVEGRQLGCPINFRVQTGEEIAVPSCLPDILAARQPLQFVAQHPGTEPIKDAVVEGPHKTRLGVGEADDHATPQQPSGEGRTLQSAGQIARAGWS